MVFFLIKKSNLMQILCQLTNFKISEEGIWKKSFLSFSLLKQPQYTMIERGPKGGNKCSTKIQSVHIQKPQNYIKKKLKMKSSQFLFYFFTCTGAGYDGMQTLNLIECNRVQNSVSGTTWDYFSCFEGIMQIAAC